MQTNPEQSPVIRFAAALLVLLVALVVFHGTTRNPFLWDTLDYLGPHEFWFSSLAPRHLWWMATALEMANWHPLTWLSWAVDYQVHGGFNFWGFHFTNNLLHAVNSALVFALALRVYRLEATDRKPARGPLLVGAVVAGLLFAVHPQHVESVAWVAERKDVLCMMFMLLSILSYLRYGSGQARRTGVWYVLGLALFVLAIASKPMAVTLPVILLLLDVYPLRRTALTRPPERAAKPVGTGRLLAEKLPYLLFSVLSVVITLLAQQVAMKEIGMGLRVLNAFNSIVFYLQKLVAPVHLSPFYPHVVEVAGSVTWLSWLPVAAVLAVTALALLAWRRGKPAWLIAWLVYLVSLAPVLGLIQVGVQGAADRYAYFPTLPAYLLAGFGIARLLRYGERWVKTMALAAAAAAVIALAHLTQLQIGIWGSSVALWTRAVERAPDSVLPALRLGVAYLNAAEFARAEAQFARLALRHPQLTDARVYLALAHQEQGHHRAAIGIYRDLAPESGQPIHPDIDRNCAWYNRGWSQLQLGRRQDALASFQRVDPSSYAGQLAALWIDRLDAESDRPVDPDQPPGTCKRPLSRMNSRLE